MIQNYQRISFHGCFSFNTLVPIFPLTILLLCSFHLSHSSQSLGFILSTVCLIQTSLEGLVPLPGNTLNLSMDFQTSFGGGVVKMMTFLTGTETATLGNFL